MELRTASFQAKEFRCKCDICNREQVHKCTPELLDKLQELRDSYGKPMILTSAYRCENHPVEAKKAVPGQHNKGTAVDILVKNGAEAHDIMKLAYSLDFTCVVLGPGFVHVDVRDGRGTTWRY